MYLKKLLGDAYKEGMTPEEIAQALETAGVGVAPDDDSGKEIERLKAALTKSNSENAEWKKKLREKQTEEERKAQEDAEKIETLQNSYNELLKDKTVSEYTAQLLGLGYSKDLAAETAQAMHEGDSAKVFSNQKKHLEAQEKELRAAILKETPAPPPGSGGSGEIDYQKKIDEAQSNGDVTAAAYYTRLMAQEAAQATE